MGTTRAKEWLTLSWSAQTRRYGDVHRNQPSRFLHELPQADLHWQGKDPEADKEVTRETAESHMARIKAISYRMSYSVAPALLGVVCIAALAAVLVLPIPFGTRVPVGALMLAAGGGLVWLRGMKRHVVEFVVDGKVLSWRSKAGEFKDREVIVQKVLSFARAAGLFRESPGGT